MSRRSPAVPALVIALVVALGSLTAASGAYAAGVTVAKVKSIIKAQAPTLKVKKAKVAKNAKKLAGKPASAYLDTATTFVLPVQAAATSRDYAFNGLAPGTYQVSYNVVMNIGAGNGSNCQLYASGTTGDEEGWTYGTQFSALNSHAATTLLTVGAGPAPNLHCSGGDTWTISTTGGRVSRVTFVPLDSVSAGTPPVGAKSSG